MLVLSYLAAIRFSDADAGEFLHNQLSADVLALASGESTFACYCEPKGRVLALMLVARENDDYYVIMSRPLVTAVSQRLKIYVMRSKVEISVLDEYAIAGLDHGAADHGAASDVTTIAVPGSKDRLKLIPAESAGAANPARENAWKLAELKRGIVWLCAETSGQFLPQMLGYDSLGAVNFRKGCYPGQEIVARTHYLGKVKRHPRLLCTQVAICPSPLDKIQIRGADQYYDAVIADCGQREDGGGCLFVVTRMEPGLEATQLEYQGQYAELGQ